MAISLVKARLSSAVTHICLIKEHSNISTPRHAMTTTQSMGSDLKSERPMSAEESAAAPHPALVQMVRLLARADARRAPAEERAIW